MRIRIGTTNHNYRHYGHGRSNMSEFERLLHLIVSLQILFGSRRGAIWVPIVVLGLIFGGIFLYNHLYNNAERSLAEADRKWNTGVVEQKMEAINEYMAILVKKDENLLDQFLNPGKTSQSDAEPELLLKDRERREVLYKRIIKHKFRFVDPDDAAHWAEKAINEGFDLKFIDEMGDPEEDLTKFWTQASKTLRGENVNRSNGDSREPPEQKKGKFDVLPGVDGVSHQMWRMQLAA